MKEIKLEPTFIRTKNVRNFEVMMDALSLGEGEGRFGMVWGESGRGKSRAATWFHAHNGCVYLRTKTVWKYSENEFLWDLARELAILNPPRTKGRCFAEIIERLLADPRPIFLDEIERLPGNFLEILRDITDISTAPVILIGEEELLPYVHRNRRVWRRTHHQVQFEPVSQGDIIVYAAEASGLKLTPAVANILYRSHHAKISDGNFGLIKLAMLALVHNANAKGTRDITEEMARVAVKTGLSGL